MQRSQRGSKAAVGSGVLRAQSTTLPSLGEFCREWVPVLNKLIEFTWFSKVVLAMSLSKGF